MLLMILETPDMSEQNRTTKSQKTFHPQQNQQR